MNYRKQEKSLWLQEVNLHLTASPTMHCADPPYWNDAGELGTHTFVFLSRFYADFSLFHSAYGYHFVMRKDYVKL